MYLAGTTRGGAGGTGTLVVCAGCSCSACGGGTGFVGSLTVCCRCASAGETRTVESIRRSRDLLTFFISGLPFRRGETFRVPFRDATGRPCVAQPALFAAHTGAGA